MSGVRGLYIDTRAASNATQSQLQAIPSLQVSPPPDHVRRENHAYFGLDHASISRDRIDAEKRKALSFIIGQLQARPRVQSAFEPFRTHVPPPMDKRLVIPINSLVPMPYVLPGRKETIFSTTTGSDDEDDNAYTRANTLFDQVAAMCNFLINAKRDGWQGLNQSYTAPIIPSEPKSPVSSSPFRRRTSFVDNTFTNEPARDSQLTQCIVILGSLVTDDCRITPTHASVKRPPYALHALTLDFASALSETQLHNPVALADIGFAMIPAFATFPSTLILRLLRFFQNELLHPMLDLLRSERFGGHMKDTRGAPPSEGEVGISIHVDEIQDPISSSDTIPDLGWTPWSSPQSTVRRIVASTAARQSLIVYRLSSLVSPLLSALFNAPGILAAFSQLDVAYEVCRLLDTIVRCKADAYIDILESLAFHTTESRPLAAGALSTFWPRAFGHVFVGSPLPTFSYPEVLSIYDARSEFGQARIGGIHPLAHEFILWRFCDSVNARPDAPQGDCQVCSNSIHGLGLLCPFCMCSVHIQCYDDPAGTFIRSSADPSAQQQATRTNPVMLFSRVLPMNRTRDSLVSLKNHPFHLINLFTLSLCGACQKPLWGISKQAFMCAACGIPVHRACMRSSDLGACKPSTPPSHHSVDLATLRRSFVDHYRSIILLEANLYGKGYDELSVIYSVLWTQLQILGLGVSKFTINIEAQIPGAPKQELADFELQYLVRLYQAQLSALRYDLCPVIKEFIYPHTYVADHMILYDWSLLTYIASLVKTPTDAQGSNTRFSSVPSQDLLMPSANEAAPDDAGYGPQAYETVEVAHLRDALGYEMHITNDRAALELLQHIYNVGFFAREDGEPCIDDGATDLKTVMCTFALPIALDVNGDSVETLVSAIEACLADVNITINETGFLLLVRRCWPSSRHTEYALSRLTRVVLQWIFAEDDRLIVVARDYDREGIPVPGVPNPTDVYPWPKTSMLQESQRVSSNYVGYRRFLLQRYAMRWLRALHDQDPRFYAITLFTHAADFAAESDVLDGTEVTDLTEHAKIDGMIIRADQILKFITKLCQTSVIFSTFDVVMLQWLEAITSLCMLNRGAIVFKSLPRLCTSDPDRTNSAEEPVTAVMADRFPTIDLWRVVDETAQKGGDDLLQALQWMRIMAQSGVDIPMNTYKQLAGVIRDNGSPLEQAITLVEAMVATTWLKPVGKQALQRLITHMHGRYSDFISEELRTSSSITHLIQFIRQSMAVCLLLAGCERETILELSLLANSEVDPLPRRNISPPRPERPEVLDSDLVSDLVRYVTNGPEVMASYVAGFFTGLLARPNLLEPQEVAGFVLMNGHILSTCAWHLYDIQLHSLSVMRMKFLLHVLIADAQPFENILAETFSSDNWELRFQALTRLFRIILDVTNPQFYVDGHQWRAAVALLFVYFFEALWCDDKETIRLAADTWVQTLLPAHIDAIADCWDAYISTAATSGKVRLVNFLIQLQPHFPKWQTLSWTTLVETLFVDTNTDSVQYDNDVDASHLVGYGFPPSTESLAAMNKEVDGRKLLTSVITLALNMVANGIAIPVQSMLKLKMHLALAMGFAQVELSASTFGNDYYVVFSNLQELPESAYPCINPVLKVIDAPERVKYQLSSMGIFVQGDPLVEGLVGEFFVDISLRVLSNATNIAKLPYVVQRGLIESLIIAIHKHDVENNISLKRLQAEMRSAVRSVTDLLLVDASYDIHHLALTTASVFLKQHPKLCAKIINHQVYTVVTLLSDLKTAKDDSLFSQGRGFLVSAFSQFAQNGLFWNLAKKPLAPSVFSALQIVLRSHSDTISNVASEVQAESLADAVLRSTINFSLEQVDDSALEHVSRNLQLFVELVHHQDYTAEMIQFLGASLSKFSAQAAEWEHSGMDPNHILSIAVTVILHNRTQSRELLGHLEDYLRVALRKLDISKESIERTLQVASAFSRRGGPTNHIALAILDVFSDALTGKIRMTTTTLRAISDTLSSQSLDRNDRQHVFPPDQIIECAGQAIIFLNTLTVPDKYQQSDVYAFLSTAALVVRVALHDVGFLRTVISGNRIRLRAWNLLVLQALRDPSPTIVVQLLSHLPLYAQSFDTELQIAFNTGSASLLPPPIVIGDVAHAAVGIRLWLLLVRCRYAQAATDPFRDGALEGLSSLYDSLSRDSLPSDGGDTNGAEWRVWNELWPALERFSRALVNDGTPIAAGTLAELAWAQVVDLIYFLRLSESAVAQETASFSALLDTMQSMPLEKSLSSKLARTVTAFSDGLMPWTFDALVAQTADQLWVAEKAYSAMNVSNAPRRTVDGPRRRAAMVTA